MAGYSLLAVSTDAKTPKGEALGYLTGILYMTPADAAGDGHNFCPFASAGCRATCLNTAGHGATAPVQAGRLRKRRWFLADRPGFLAALHADIARLERQATVRGLRPCVRLNGTTDLAWELLAPDLFRAFPGVTFYDYTKIPQRMARQGRGSWPENYLLTFSRSETNDDAADRVLANGGTVAVVFTTRKGEPLPAVWYGHGARVIDGDQSDLRFLDPRGVVVGLRAKGRAKHDMSGFVVPA